MVDKKNSYKQNLLSLKKYQSKKWFGIEVIKEPPYKKIQHKEKRKVKKKVCIYILDALVALCRLDIDILHIMFDH